MGKYVKISSILLLICGFICLFNEDYDYNVITGGIILVFLAFLVSNTFDYIAEKIHRKNTKNTKILLGILIVFLPLSAIAIISNGDSGLSTNLFVALISEIAIFTLYYIFFSDKEKNTNNAKAVTKITAKDKGPTEGKSSDKTASRLQKGFLRMDYFTAYIISRSLHDLDKRWGAERVSAIDISNLIYDFYQDMQTIDSYSKVKALYNPEYFHIKYEDFLEKVEEDFKGIPEVVEQPYAHDKKLKALFNIIYDTSHAKLMAYAMGKDTKIIDNKILNIEIENKHYKDNFMFTYDTINTGALIGILLFADKKAEELLSDKTFHDDINKQLDKTPNQVAKNEKNYQTKAKVNDDFIFNLIIMISINKITARTNLNKNQQHNDIIEICKKSKTPRILIENLRNVK